MFFTAKTFWEITSLIVAQTVISMIVFAALLSLLVFFLRPRVRKFKPRDMAVFNKLEGITSQGMNKFMLFITFLGNHKFLIPANIAAIIYFLFFRDGRWFSIRVAVIALSSLILMLALKELFRRKRPLAPLLKAVRGLSFPSGHAIMSTTFYGIVAYTCWHTVENPTLKIVLVILLMVLTALIGFSRIY